MKTLQEQRTEAVLKMQERISELESGCGMCYRKDKENLTKAKELLKRCYENYVYLEPLRSEIEQFLSEVDK